MGSGLRKSRANNCASISPANKSKNIIMRLSTKGSLTINGIRVAFQELNCVKIRQPVSNISIISKELNLTGSKFFLHSMKYTSEYKFIQETQIKYLTLLEEFKTNSHEVCIPGFQIPDGLFLLMISLFAEKSIKIKFTRSAPFFKCNPPSSLSTQNFLNSWSSLHSFLESMSINSYQKLQKCQSRLEDFLYFLHLDPLSIYTDNLSESIFLVQCAILTASSLLKQIQKDNEKISLFFKTLSQKESQIRELGSKSREFNCNSAQHIFHHILNNKLN